MFASSLFMFVSHFFILLNLGLEAKRDYFNYDEVQDQDFPPKKEIMQNNSRRVKRVHKDHPLNNKRAAEEDMYERMAKRRREDSDSNNNLGPCQGFAGKKVYILSADTKKGLARCHSCGPGADPDSADVQGLKGDKLAQWTMVEVGDRCALKADTGKYAARCDGCWRGGAAPESVFVHIKDQYSRVAGWKIEPFKDGYSFQADNGRYMARCDGCVPGGSKSNFAFLHATQPVAWIIEEVK